MKADLPAFLLSEASLRHSGSTKWLKFPADVLPLWVADIAPVVKSGQRVIIAAHGNSLRALVKYLDEVSEKDILDLNIPTGVPLVYELDKDLKPIKHYYLGDADKIAASMASVANQGKSK